MCVFVPSGLPDLPEFENVFLRQPWWSYFRFVKSHFLWNGRTLILSWCWSSDILFRFWHFQSSCQSTAVWVTREHYETGAVSQMLNLQHQYSYNLQKNIIFLSVLKREITFPPCRSHLQLMQPNPCMNSLLDPAGRSLCKFVPHCLYASQLDCNFMWRRNSVLFIFSII